MALKRILPDQDTFIVSASSDVSFGADEILELGCTEYGDSPARILLQFPVTYIEDNLKDKDYKAILHLNLSEAEHLPSQVNLIASTVPQQWQEGVGRSGDLGVLGATWEETGCLDLQGTVIKWNEPGAESTRVFDGNHARVVSIRYIINGGTSDTARTGSQISGGGAQGWGTLNPEGVLQRYEQGSYVPGLGILSDLELDVTEITKAWTEGLNTGLILQFENEVECVLFGSRISFYSKETHTIYRPYLELRWNEAEYEPGDLTECKDLFGTFSNNLRKEYNVQDLARIDLSVKDRYAPRVWSTGSIYQIQHVLPETSYWGIKDEYTREMVIPFSSEYTRVSADASGSFFMLDVGNLEPERYYRLLLQVEKEGQKVVVDTRNIFRVNQNGQS